MVKSASILFLIVMASTSVIIEGSRILISAPFGTKSHKNMYVPLVRELVSRGHDITVVTNYFTAEFAQLDGNNVREIVLDQLSVDMSQYPNAFDSLLSSSNHWWNLGFSHLLLLSMFRYTSQVTEALYGDARVQQMMANDQFDLVIASQVLSTASAPLAWHFQAPLIVTSPNTFFAGMATVLGDDEHTSYVPFVFTRYTDQMNLAQRTINTVVTKMCTFLQQLYEELTIPAIVKETGGMTGCPPVQNIIRNVTMVFTNSHPSFTYPRSLPPQVVEVGGLHCRPAQALPSHLETFLSSGRSDDGGGFLLFSVGSLQRMEDMPERVIQSFIGTFARLPGVRVVWQWKGKRRTDLPSNVLAIPWLPQQDLLGHAGCRGFITHGGLNSLQEAIFHGVPVLGLPFGIDQYLNLARAVNDGYALQLEWKDIDESTLSAAIEKLLFNRSFSIAAKRLSGLLRDQLQSPLERAVFWTEYVIRHNGSMDHLRLGSRKLAPYQRSLIDVYLVLVLIASLPLWLVFLCLRCCWSTNKTKAATAMSKKSKQE